MDRIQDKAAKFFNGVRMKKSTLENKSDINDCIREQAKTVLIQNADISCNNCCYCQKIFFTPKFLLKHIFRRHPEKVVSLHKKCVNSETNNNSTDAKYLLDYIREEFSKLREEISSVQQVYKNSENVHSNLFIENKACNISGKCDLQHKTSVSNMIPVTSPKNSSVVTVSNEFKVIKEKVLDLENNLLCLHNTFDELDGQTQEKLSKEEVHKLISFSENKILNAQKAHLNELRCNLQKDMHTMLNHQLSENNNEWRSQFARLRKEIERLDNMVDLIRKQINSPDYLDILEKKLEKHIVCFLNNTSRTKNRVSKTRNSALRKSSIGTSHKVSSLRSNEKSDNKSDCNIEIVHFSRKDENNVSYTNYELSALLAEKMSLLGITPSTSKISYKEYEEKMKLIEFRKKQFGKQNKYFFTIYNKINKQADERVASKFKKKKCHKLRFSEPLIVSETIRHEHNENFPNRTFPASEYESMPLSSNKTIHLSNNQKEFQNLPDSQLVNEKNPKFNTVHNDGDGDYFRKFSDNLKSENNLQSTPLKELGVSNNAENNMFSNDDCLLNSVNLLCFAEKGYSETSGTENEKLMKRETHKYTNEILSPQLKNSLENNGNLSDEYGSSLESCSSWEDYVNNL